jgi:hypothetical protein
VTPATRAEKKKVEANKYEEWIMERVRRKHTRRI